MHPCRTRFKSSDGLSVKRSSNTCPNLLSSSARHHSNDLSPQINCRMFRLIWLSNYFQELHLNFPRLHHSHPIHSGLGVERRRCCRHLTEPAWGFRDHHVQLQLKMAMSEKNSLTSPRHLGVDVFVLEALYEWSMIQKKQY